MVLEIERDFLSASCQTVGALQHKEAEDEHDGEDGVSGRVAACKVGNRAGQKGQHNTAEAVGTLKQPQGLLIAPAQIEMPTVLSDPPKPRKTEEASISASLFMGASTHSAQPRIKLPKSR